jgi:hypothetical protein
VIAGDRGPAVAVGSDQSGQVPGGDIVRQGAFNARSKCWLTCAGLAPEPFDDMVPIHGYGMKVLRFWYHP